MPWGMIIGASLAVLAIIGRAITSGLDDAQIPQGASLTPDSEPLQASRELSAEVSSAVALMDSYAKSRSGGSYQIHVTVQVSASLEPIGFEIVDPDTGMQTYSGELSQETDLSCVRVDLRDSAGNILYDNDDPYTPVRRAESVVYESESIPLTWPGIDRFANGASKAVNLIVRSGGRDYVVKDLELTWKCTWIQD